MALFRFLILGATSDALQVSAPRARMRPLRSAEFDSDDVSQFDLDAICADLGLTVAAPAAPGAPLERDGAESLASLASPAAAPLAAADLLAFERDGHLCTRGLFTAAEVAAMAAPVRAIGAREEAAALGHARDMNDGGDGGAPFLQTFNPHRRSAAAAAIATCPRLAAVAAQLLGVGALRLYQSCVFVKRAGDEPTNWHSDLHTSPLDSNAFVTAWFPLHAVEAGGTGLAYATASHRDLALAMWQGGQVDAGDRYAVADHGRYAVGDVSWHHGWCLHGAPANGGDDDRVAFTVSFFADGGRIVDEAALAVVNDEDHPSYDAWLGDVDPGGLADHALLPVVEVPPV